MAGIGSSGTSQPGISSPSDVYTAAAPKYPTTTLTNVSA